MVDPKFTPVWVPEATDEATMITSGGLSDTFIDIMIKEDEIEKSCDTVPVDVVCKTLLNLCNSLKLEIKSQEVSRSVREYDKKLFDAAVLIIKYYTGKYRKLQEVKND